MDNTAYAPEAFIKALQKNPISCQTAECKGSVEAIETSQRHDRIKSFNLR